PTSMRAGWPPSRSSSRWATRRWSSSTAEVRHRWWPRSTRRRRSHPATAAGSPSGVTGSSSSPRPATGSDRARAARVAGDGAPRHIAALESVPGYAAPALADIHAVLPVGARASAAGGPTMAYRILRPFALFAMMALAGTAIAAAQDCTGTITADEAMKAETARYAAQTSNDFPAMEKMFGSDLTYNHSSAATDNKATYIDAMRSGRTRYRKI